MTVLGTAKSEYEVVPGKDLAPNFALTVNGHELDDNIMKVVQSIEYDSADNIADMMKLVIANKDFIVSDKKLFQVGNTIKLWMGFDILSYVGAGIIEKVRPYFPSEGMPTIEIIAYSADRFMMRNSPDSSDEKKPFMTEKEQKKQRKKEHKNKVLGYQNIKGRIWPESTLFSNVVEEKAEAYGFAIDVDETNLNLSGPQGIVQKVGMTDYQLIAGMANQLIWLFWVDMEEEDDYWTLHFKDPDLIGEIQDRKYTFRYNSFTDGESPAHRWSGSAPTTLIEFDGEQMMGHGPTDLKIQVKNPKTGQLESFSVVGDPADESDEFVGDAKEDGEGSEASSEVALSFNNVAVKVIADKQFSSPAEVKEWAEKWYQDNHRDFYSGSGTVRGPGVETLRAMHVHGIEGLGKRWSGDYYMVSVNHKMSAQDGYMVQWSGRKVTAAAGSDFATATSNIDTPDV